MKRDKVGCLDFYSRHFLGTKENTPEKKLGPNSLQKLQFMNQTYHFGGQYL